MRVAVVGSGISGLASAWHLQHRARVTLYEAQNRIGGHTDTHSILTGGRTYAVDSGFIVFHDSSYPGFSAWLRELDVESQPTDLSFGLRNVTTGLEYGTASLSALFCQPRNLASPRFLGMLRDLRRFYVGSVRLDARDMRTLGDFLEAEGYGRAFQEEHLLPMCAALWSAPVADARRLPAAHVLAFRAWHGMLQLTGRPQWRVVRGGSRRYVEAFERRFVGTIARGERVLGIARLPGQVVVRRRSGSQSFDAVVLACHSDQALALLEDPSAAEREILGAIRYQRNRVVIHSDPAVMPVNVRAWSSWNALVSGGERPGQVTYWMNRLQALPPTQPLLVTVNPDQALRDVWGEREYAIPAFDARARAAQQRRGEINGVRGTWYCGAYWGRGLHEDGFVSGRDVAEALSPEAHRAA
jgi:uncharacterized protein